MTNRPLQAQGQSRLGATWNPGGQDGYYVPEVVSPSPQRFDPALSRFVYGGVFFILPGCG